MANVQQLAQQTQTVLLASSMGPAREGPDNPDKSLVNKKCVKPFRPSFDCVEFVDSTSCTACLQASTDAGSLFQPALRCPLRSANSAGCLQDAGVWFDGPDSVAGQPHAAHSVILASHNCLCLWQQRGSQHCTNYADGLPSAAMLCRLTFPYITWTILQETFGRIATEIVAKYLVEFKPGYYRFRTEVDT